MNKKIIYGLLSLLLLLVAIASSSHLIKAKPQPEKNDQNHSITYVQAQKVNYKDVDSKMNYRGRVTAFDNVSLSAEVSGKILQGDVRFKAGERFRKGQVLLRIYSEDVEALLKSGKSTYLQTIAGILPDLKVDYPDEYDKWYAFFKAIDVDKALPALPQISSNKEKVFLASNSVLSSYYTLREQEINLTRYTIRAPFNGSFKTVNKEIGAVSSLGTELATLIRTDKLEVTVPVFPSDLEFLHVGDKVKITNQRGVSQYAELSRISDFVEAETQSVNVYLSYSASGSTGFLEGEYVDVYFEGAKVHGFEIPREALVDGESVYVLEGKTLRKEPVDVLRSLQDSYVIAVSDTSALVVTESVASIDANAEYQAR